MKDIDPTSSDADKAEGSKSIKAIYLTMLKVPEADVRNNPSLTEIDRKPGTNFPFYEPDTKHAVLPIGQANDPGNAIGNTTDRTTADGKVIPAELVDVDDACKPNNAPNPTYLSWSTLHEVAHGADDKNNIMVGKGGIAFADWKTHTVPEVAAVAAKAFNYDEVKDIEALLTGKAPKKTPPANVVEWCKAVVGANELWEKGAESIKRAIDGRVYHQGGPGNAWSSYKIDARKQGITGYQFRAAGEWFAELYAAFYSGKLKPNHPHVPWLKKVQGQS